MRLRAILIAGGGGGWLAIIAISIFPYNLFFHVGLLWIIHGSELCRFTIRSSIVSPMIKFIVVWRCSRHLIPHLGVGSTRESAIIFLLSLLWLVDLINLRFTRGLTLFLSLDTVDSGCELMIYKSQDIPCVLYSLLNSKSEEMDDVSSRWVTELLFSVLMVIWWVF